jgi:hypothetical protein
METVAAQAGGVAAITTFGTSPFPAFGLPPTL